MQSQKEQTQRAHGVSSSPSNSKFDAQNKWCASAESQERRPVSQLKSDRGSSFLEGMICLFVLLRILN